MFPDPFDFFSHHVEHWCDPGRIDGRDPLSDLNEVSDQCPEAFRYFTVGGLLSPV